MKQRIRKFNGHKTRTVRVPSVFYPQCDHLAVLLAEGYTLEGVIRNHEGRAVRQIHYLQTGVEDRLTVMLEPPLGNSVEGYAPEAVFRVEPTCAIATLSGSYEVMLLPMFSPVVAENSVNHTRLHQPGLAAVSSPLGVSLLEARKTGFGLPVTSGALSRSQTFGKRLFRAWRSLALEKSKGSETPWNCYVEIEEVYRQGFSTVQGTAFLYDLANLEGKEVNFGGILQLNTLDEGEEGIEMNGRYVSALTFTLNKRASGSIVSKTIPLTVTVNSEASVTANTGQFADGVTQVERQSNGLTIKLQQLFHKLMPRIG